MAEYAGLEIRIGGNTSSLNKALSASTKSAADLQSRIRQITKAMQFDPTSIANVETRIKITGDRMQSLQTKARLARTALSQLGDSVVTVGGKGKTVRDLASETDNLSLKAKQADQRFETIRDSLAKVYETWNGAARRKGVDFLSEQLGIDKETAKTLMSTSTSLDVLMREMKDMQNERRNGFNTSRDGIYGNLPEISNKDIETVRRLRQLNFHGMFDRDENLDGLIEQAKDLGIQIDDGVVEAVHRMRTEFIRAQDDKKAFDSALQFEQLDTDVQRLDSEAVSMSNVIRRLDDGMTEVTRGSEFQAMEGHIREVDAALDTVNADLERTEAAMELDPDNIDLAVRRFDDLRQKVELGEDRVATLRSQLEALDANGASEAAESHQDLAQWVEQSAENAREANLAWSDQKGAVKALDDQVASLQQHIAILGKDSTMASMSETVQKWLDRTKKLDEANEDLAKKMATRDSAASALADKRGSLDRENEKLEEYNRQIDDLRAKMQAAQEAMDGATDFESFESANDSLVELGNRLKEVESNASAAKDEIARLRGEVKEQEVLVGAADRAVSNAQEHVNNLTTTVKNLEGTGEVRAFRNFPEEVERCEAELAELKGDLRSAQEEERQLASAYKAAESENELAKSAKKVRELRAEITDTTNETNEAREAMKGLDVGPLITPSTLKSIGMTMSATVTPIVLGVGNSMLEASSTVDAAYRDMRKTVDATDEEFERLRRSAIDFSRTHVTSADQILQIEAIGGELGIATENLETFAEVISNIDVATNLDTESAAEALGHLANIMNLTESDYVGFSDALVRLGNNGASTESEIANIAERIGSMASIVNMSAPDVLAWASSIASTGQNAEAAGTAISKTMSFFETAVSAAGGTIDTSFEAIGEAVQNGGSDLVVFSNLMGQTADEFAEAWDSDPKAVFEQVKGAVDEAKGSLQGIADVANMSADDFAKAWESDPTSVMEAFIKGLNRIESSGGSADAVLQGFGITSVRQKQAIEGLMQTIDGLDDNLQMSRDAWNGVFDEWGTAGDAANEAAKKAEGFSGQMQILKNMWQVTLSELGEGAVPYIKLFTGALEELTAWFTNAGMSTKTFVVGAGGIAAATGPVLTFVSTLKTAISNVGSWADEAITSSSLVKEAFASGGEEAVKALTGTMTGMQKMKLIASSLGSSLLRMLAGGAIAAGVVALGAVLATLYQDWRNHVKATDGLADALANVGKSAEAAASGIESGMGDIQSVMQDVGKSDERLAHLADTIGESNDKYGAYAGQMEYYSGVIRDLGGRSDLTREEMAKLSAAMDAVNEQCGTSYAFDEYGQLIDTATGKVQANTDALLANIDARKQQALIDYYADDYAEATEDWAKAQAEVNDLMAEQKRISTDQGRAEWIQNYVDKTGRPDLADQAFDLHVDEVATSLAKANEELVRTSDAMATIEGKINDAKGMQEQYNAAIEESTRKQEEYDKRVDTVTGDVTGNMSRLSAAVREAGGDDAAFNAIADGLESIHVYADELGNVSMEGLVSSFDGVNGSMAQVIETLENAGVSTASWHAAIDEVPEAAELMGTMTASAFATMYQSAGQDLGATMELIGGLEAMQVGDKTFYVGDGGTIMDAQGQLYDLSEDLVEIPDEVISKLCGDDTDLLNKTMEDKRRLQEVNSYTARSTLTANDYASPVADDLIRTLDRIPRQVTTTITTIENVVKAKQATGGMNSRAVIPMHASGYIATGPTLTNQGWIGEDGIEAVANWATGGAVVPLTNRKYMLPIADAIADGMAARGVGGGGDTITIHLNYQAGDDANQMARDLARALGRIQRTGR